MLQRDQRAAVARMNLADEPVERAPRTLDSEHPQLLGSDRAIDEISYERGMVTPDIDGAGDTGGGLARAGRFEQVLGLDGELDQRVKTRISRKVEDGFRLLLAQHQGGGMRVPQTLQPMLEHEPLAEIQRGLDISKPHRFKKKFLTSAGEKFPLRKDSRPGALVW